MATKQFTARRDFKYGTRMLRAGDTVEMAAPHARVFSALGAIEPLAFRARSVAALAALAEGEEITITPGNVVTVRAPAKLVKARRKRKAKAKK